jgi:hypothetical protein
MLDALVHALPEDPVEALNHLMNSFSEMKYESGSDIDEDLFGYYCLLHKAIEKASLGLKIDFNVPNYSSAVISKKIKTIIEEIKPLLVSMKVEWLLEKRKSEQLIPNQTLYKIQSDIDNLRKTIMHSRIFSDEHKERLLLQLERLQKELHKTVPNVDLLFAYAVKTCVVIESLGKSSKPLSDNVVNVLDSARKLVQQIWGVSPDLPALPPGQQTTLSIGSE